MKKLSTIFKTLASVSTKPPCFTSFQLVLFFIFWVIHYFIFILILFTKTEHVW